MHHLLLKLLLVIHRTTILVAYMCIGSVIFKYVEDRSWNDSTHFIWTLVSTIGYGIIYPKKTNGRIFTVVYGLFGIPLCLYTLVAYGHFINACFKSLIITVEGRIFKQKRAVKYMSTKIFILTFLFMNLNIWTAAAIYQETEDLSYFDSAYAWFVTYTTVGFGDIVPHRPGKSSLLGVFLFVNLLGLAGMASILTAIQDMLKGTRRSRILRLVFACYGDDDDSDDSRDMERHSKKFDDINGNMGLSVISYRGTTTDS